MMRGMSGPVRHSLPGLAARICAVLAVLVWALMPHGVMPGVAADGSAAFVLCTGDGPLRVQIGADGMTHPAPAGGEDEHREPCPYAAAGPALNLPETLAVPVEFAVSAMPAPLRLSPPPAVRSHLRPGPTGPPAFS